MIFTRFGFVHHISMEEVERKNYVRKFGSRMSLSGLQSMIVNMSSEQRQAVKDIGFGVFVELGFGALNKGGF